MKCWAFLRLFPIFDFSVIFKFRLHYTMKWASSCHFQFPISGSHCMLSVPIHSSLFTFFLPLEFYHCYGIRVSFKFISKSLFEASSEFTFDANSEFPFDASSKFLFDTSLKMRKLRLDSIQVPSYFPLCVLYCNRITLKSEIENYHEEAQHFTMWCNLNRKLCEMLSFFAIVFDFRFQCCF